MSCLTLDIRYILCSCFNIICVQDKSNKAQSAGSFFTSFNCIFVILNSQWKCSDSTQMPPLSSTCASSKVWWRLTSQHCQSFLTCSDWHPKLMLISDRSSRWAADVWSSMELPWCCCWGLWVNSAPCLPLCLTLSWELSSAPCSVWSQQWDCPTCSLLIWTPPGTSLFWASLSSLGWCCQATSNKTRWSQVSGGERHPHVDKLTCHLK